MPEVNGGEGGGGGGGGRGEQLPVPYTREENASTIWPPTFLIGSRSRHHNAGIPPKASGNHSHGGEDAGAEGNALLSRVSSLAAGMLLIRPRKSSINLRRDEREKAPRPLRKSVRTHARARACASRVSGVPAFFSGVWRGLVALEGRCEASCGGRAWAHVVAGALASSHSVAAIAVVGVAAWVSCAKRLAPPIGDSAPRDNSKGDWKQVARYECGLSVGM